MESHSVIPEMTERDPQSSDDENQLPQAEPDNVSNHNDSDMGVIDDQNNSSGDDDRYQFSSNNGSQIISQATRVMPLAQEEFIGMHATRASKPEVSTVVGNSWG